MTPLELFSAYVIDLILGDPPRLPHPIKMIGKEISFLEGILKKDVGSRWRERAAGLVLVMAIVSSVFLITYFVITLSTSLSAVLGFLVTVFLAYSTLATRSLHVESKKVILALREGDLEKARDRLSHLVGRDTENLDQGEIIRALTETIAENTSDGIVAPLFYLGIGGVPLAMAYKAINTLDSMVGYKNERYLNFGWASAKSDDIVNYISARITGILIVVSSLLLNMSWRESWRIMRRDGRKHSSPNSGIPEAAVASSLGIRLGGTNYYLGKPNHKPLIGEGINPLDEKAIRKTTKLMYTTSFLMLIICILWLFISRFSGILYQG
ncbi:MAG: adenosylcobinamide-phosphate synthase CbiB [Pseudomonadota bacterium]